MTSARVRHGCETLRCLVSLGVGTGGSRFVLEPAGEHPTVVCLQTVTPTSLCHPPSWELLAQGTHCLLFVNFLARTQTVPGSCGD